MVQKRGKNFFLKKSAKVWRSHFVKVLVSCSIYEFFFLRSQSIDNSFSLFTILISFFTFLKIRLVLDIKNHTISIIQKKIFISLKCSGNFFFFVTMMIRCYFLSNWFCCFFLIFNRDVLTLGESKND